MVSLAPWFQYPITRNFSSPFFSPVLAVVGFIWMMLITIMCLAAVGYEYESIFTTDFNSTTRLWYEKLFPTTPWTPHTKICQPAILKVQECKSTPFTIFILTISACQSN